LARESSWWKKQHAAEKFLVGRKWLWEDFEEGRKPSLKATGGLHTLYIVLVEGSGVLLSLSLFF